MPTENTLATENPEKAAIATHETPVGPLTLTASEVGLTHIMFRPVRRPAAPSSPAAWQWLDLARRELDVYLGGRLQVFTMPVDLRRVSAAHRRILDALLDVTYGELAATVGLAEDDLEARDRTPQLPRSC